jgi:hypothetical protein
MRHSEGGFHSSAVICQACGYGWVAVYPCGEPHVDEDAVECPACLQLSGRVPTMDELPEQWVMYPERKGDR